MEVKVKSFKVENLDQLQEALLTILKELKESKCDCECTESPKLSKENEVLEGALDNLCEKFSCSLQELEAILSKISSFNKGAALSLVLREMALVLDKKYEDNIRNCEEVYGVSFVTGKIVKIPKRVIRGYNGFAAFRTLEDAKLACSILKNILKDMFSGK